MGLLEIVRYADVRIAIDDLMAAAARWAITIAFAGLRAVRIASHKGGAQLSIAIGSCAIHAHTTLIGLIAETNAIQLFGVGKGARIVVFGGTCVDDCTE